MNIQAMIARHTSPLDTEECFKKGLPESVEMNGLKLIEALENDAHYWGAFDAYKPIHFLEGLKVVLTKNSISIQREDREAVIEFESSPTTDIGVLGEHAVRIASISYPEDRLKLVDRNTIMYQKDGAITPIKVLFAEGSEYVNEVNQKSIHHFILMMGIDL